MERLKQNMSILFDEVSQSLMKVGVIKMRKVVARSGGDLNREECRDILQRAMIVFRKKCDEQSDNLIAECELPAKMSELQDLIEFSEQLNAQTGLKEGYRPMGAEMDLRAVFNTCQENYEEVLSTEVEYLDEDIKAQQESLAEKLAQVKSRSARLEEAMAAGSE